MYHNRRKTQNFPILLKLFPKSSVLREKSKLLNPVPIGKEDTAEPHYLKEFRGWAEPTPSPTSMFRFLDF